MQIRHHGYARGVIVPTGSSKRCKRESTKHKTHFHSMSRLPVGPAYDVPEMPVLYLQDFCTPLGER